MDLSNQWSKVCINIFRSKTDNLILANVECIPDQITWLQLLHSNNEPGFDVEHYEIQGLLHRNNQHKMPIPTCGLNCLVSHILDQWRQKPKGGCYKVHLVKRTFSTVIQPPAAPRNQAAILQTTQFVCQKEEGPPIEVTSYNHQSVKREAAEVVFSMPSEIHGNISKNQIEMTTGFIPTDFQALTITSTAMVQDRNPSGLIGQQQEPAQWSAGHYQMMQGPGTSAAMEQVYEHIGYPIVNVCQGQMLPEFTPPWNAQSQQHVHINDAAGFQTYPNNMGCFYDFNGSMACENLAPTRHFSYSTPHNQVAESFPPAHSYAVSMASDYHMETPDVWDQIVQMGLDV